MPGIRRRRPGKGFSYVGADGTSRARPGDAGPDPQSRDSSGLHRRLDLPRPNGHIQATGRDARGRKQYRYHPGGGRCGTRRSSAGCSPSARRCRKLRKRVEQDLARAGPAPGEGAGDGRAAARVHRDPGRQRRIRPHQPLVRPDHAAGPPRGDLRLEAAVRVPGQERQDPPRLAQRPAARPDRARGARRCRARTCSSTWTTTAAGWRSARATSTTICGRSRARSSPPRISGPGPAPCRRSRRCEAVGAGGQRARGQVGDPPGDRPGRRAAQQHPGRVPEVLRASRGAGDLRGRDAARGPEERRLARERVGRWAHRRRAAVVRLLRHVAD